MYFEWIPFVFNKNEHEIKSRNKLNAFSYFSIKASLFTASGYKILDSVESSEADSKDNPKNVNF